MYHACLDDTIASRVERLELPFNEYGIDPYGVSKKHLRFSYEAMRLLYRHYFSVECHGIGNIPARGRAMLVGIIPAAWPSMAPWSLPRASSR